MASTTRQLCLLCRRSTASVFDGPTCWNAPLREIRRREKVIRIFPNTGSAYRLVGALCAETHEEWSTGRRYLNMDGYFQWRADRSDEQTLSEEASLNGKRTAQPTAVPA